MHWAKLAVRYFLDPKIRGMRGDLADAAEVMFVRSIAWAGELGQAGFIPEQDVELLTRRRRYADVVEVLISLGLWETVPGGYRVVRWTDWNGELDALARRRAADRERQRRRRERLTSASRDASRDVSRDVTRTEGEEEKDQEQLGGVGATRDRASRDSQPPRTCAKHPNGTSDPCGPCKEARLAHERWQQQQARQRADADRRSRDAPLCRRCGNSTASAYHRNICSREREDTP